jgi:riboflavin synthase
MFTGLITAVGEVVEVSTTDAGRTLVIAAPYEGVVAGESIACSGACLTVRESSSGRFTAAAVVTTLDRTTIGDWKVGTRLNLERALAVGDRLGGHIVQGHVDGVGRVTRAVAEGDENTLLLDIEVPADIDELVVPQGSIAVDGVSLTVQALPAPGVVRVSVIDHSLQHTTLGALRPGDSVQLEADVLAKHLKRLSAPLLQS